MASTPRPPQLPWMPPSSVVKDCLEGTCNYIYCPEWCHLPPPPPPPPPTPPGPASATHISRLLIAVISILSIFFLLTAYLLFSKLRRRPALSNAPLPLAAASAPACADGLDETLIQKLGTCEYRRRRRLGRRTATDDCSVCLGEFEDGDRIRKLPRCEHVFHVRCIDVWLQAHSSCPLCRTGILPILEVDSGYEETGCRRLGRSFSMDSPLRREVREGEDAGSERWTRVLRRVGSPVRLKRSASVSTGSSSRFVGKGITTNAALPI